MTETKHKEKSSGTMPVVVILGLFILAFAGWLFSQISSSNNKEIDVKSFTLIMEPYMKEYEQNVKDGKKGAELVSVKTPDVLKELDEQHIVGTKFKEDGTLYANKMERNKNYRLINNVMIMTPKINEDKTVSWTCNYYMAGKITGDNPFNCSKVSPVAIKKQKLKTDLAFPSKVWKDREVIAKIYKDKNQDVPNEMKEVIEKDALILKKVQERIAKKKADEKEKDKSEVKV